MSGPWPHPKSGIFYFRKETPEDLKRESVRLKALDVGYTASIHRSLKTRDPKAAEKAYSAVLLEVDAMWTQWRELLARSDRQLDHEETASLVREVVSGFLEEGRQDPAAASIPPVLPQPVAKASKHSDAAVAAMNEKERERFRKLLATYLSASPAKQATMAVEWVKQAAEGKGPYFLFRDIAPELAAAIETLAAPQLRAAEVCLGHSLTKGQRQHVALEASTLLHTGRQALAAAASFDYRPMRDLEDRLEAMPKAGKKAAKVSITSLYDLWQRDHLANNKAKATAKEYKAKVADFIKWLGHDDALRVTKGDLPNYADHLRHEKGLAPKTIHGKYLTVIKALFRRGFNADLLPVNVAAGASYAVPKRIVTRPKGYTDDEAKTILALANRALLPPEDGSKEKRSLHNRLACRWVPWLQCYTGARVAEITQLRKQDIYKEYGIPCLKIAPEAGSVKTGQYRLVPLHPHLVEMGFLEFVASQPEGPLFYERKVGRKAGNNTQAQWTGNAVSRWIKDQLGEAMPKVQPSHAWRHRFKTIGRDVGVELQYLDMIQGHSNGSASASAGYGENTMKALGREIRKIPPIQF